LDLQEYLRVNAQFQSLFHTFTDVVFEIGNDSNSIITMKSESLEKAVQLKDLIQSSRKFSLELCPKMVYSWGPLVDLLASSNVASYLEFKSLERIRIFSENSFEAVNCDFSISEGEKIYIYIYDERHYI